MQKHKCLRDSKHYLSRMKQDKLLVNALY